MFCLREAISTVEATILPEGCGFAVGGFPWSLHVEDGFVRRRALTALHERWKSEEHQLREIKLRLQLGMPLVNNNAVGASPREQKRQISKVVVSVDMHMESAYALGLNDVLDAEGELEQSSGAAGTLTKSRANKRRICQFVEGLGIGLSSMI